MVNAMMIKKGLVLNGLIMSLFLFMSKGLAEPLAMNADSSIPAEIRPPVGHTPELITHAKGDQIYQCSLRDGQYIWQVQAPDAKLLDDQGEVVGKHYSGPIWEYHKGSQVLGRIIKKIDMNPSAAIAWLLVEVVEHKGKGLLAGVSYIIRINTQGGLAPSSGCNANHLGSEKRVGYTADYIFYQ